MPSTHCSFVLALALALAPTTAQSQLPRPAGWRVKLDGATSDTVYYVQMPPGWHITTGPGALLFDASNTGRGRYALSMEVHLFPESSGEGYGVFLGGANLDRADASYVAFTANRNGGTSIERVQGLTRSLLYTAPAGTTPVKAHPGGDDTVLNLLTVKVEPDSVRFEANGTRITALGRGDLPLDGIFGFRAGPGVNLHITNLDHTARLAPPPRPKR